MKKVDESSEADATAALLKVQQKEQVGWKTLQFSNLRWGSNALISYYISHHLMHRKLRGRLGNNLKDYLTRSQGKSLMLERQKKIIIQVKTRITLIRMVQIQRVQKNHMKLQ
jgi:hypothetical protein